MFYSSKNAIDISFTLKKNFFKENVSTGKPVCVVIFYEKNTILFL